MLTRGPLRHIRRATGIPCLPVVDLDKALWYYRRFFGFAEVTPPEPVPGTAFVRGHGITLQLQRTPSGVSHASPCPDRPSAVFLVDRPRRLRRRLDDLGAHLVDAADLGPGWSDFFGVRDCYGNVLAIGPTAGAAALNRWISEPIEEISLRLHERRIAKEEARHIDEFRAFYKDLHNKDSIYYLVFNKRLLHWVVKTASYVPQSTNLVLLGSDLSPDEVAWVRKHLRRPFHHVQLRLDEGAAWELLFAVNRYDFGWIGLGTFVLDARLFDELAVLDPGTSMNCVWSWDSGFGFPIANTYFTFVNTATIGAVRERGVGTSPNVFAYQRFNRQVETRRCYSRLPSRAQIRQLRQILPADESGHPAVPGDMTSFEPTVMYQLLARTYGFEIHRVRELSGFSYVHGGDSQEENSDELLHIGELDIADVLEEFSGYFHDAEVRRLYAIAEYLTLSETARVLPPYYMQRFHEITASLHRQGLSPEAVEEAARHHLAQARGLSPTAAAAVIKSPALALT